jgi:hypothetical protein
MEHTFRSVTSGISSVDAAGNQVPSLQYRVRFSLKQKGKTVGSGQTTVEIRTGMGGN